MKFKNILLSLLLSTGFFCTSQNGITVVDSILSNGIYRKFRLYVPNSYNSNTAAPLILNLHGYTSNSMQQQLYANFMPIADTAKFLVVHPDGTSPFGSQFWNAGFSVGNPDDVLLMNDLIDSLKLIYNINLNRVYSCGMSNGGIMSYYLACNLQNRIAAIASVTGSMLNSWFTCAPNRPFPVMEIHGTSDATVPYNGNTTFAPIDSVIKKWSKHNACNMAPITTSLANTNLTDGSTVVHYKYINGTSGANVELYRVDGGSHSWPGGANVISGTNQDFSATQEIWRFFRQYTLNQFTNTSIKEKNSDEEISIFPNPTKGVIKINSNKQIVSCELLDPTGNLIKKIDTKEINLSDLHTGVYFLKVSLDANTVIKKVIKE